MSALFLLFSAAFLVGFSGALMPGPVLTVTITESMKRGFRAGPLIVLGHAILEFFLLLGLVAGLSVWLQKEIVISFLGVTGGIMLCLLGVQMIFTARKAVDQALNDKGDTASSKIGGPIMAGIITSLAHPYWILWWATIGLRFATDALRMGWPGLCSFYLGHISADLVWYCIVAFAVASGRRLCPPKVYRILIISCGFILIGIGVFFFVNGVAGIT